MKCGHDPERWDAKHRHCRSCVLEAFHRRKLRNLEKPPPPTQAELERRSWRVALSCGHDNRFGTSAPLPGELVFCPRCADFRHVDTTQVVR